jgi:hypothetical protein
MPTVAVMNTALVAVLHGAQPCPSLTDAELVVLDRHEGELGCVSCDRLRPRWRLAGQGQRPHEGWLQPHE